MRVDKNMNILIIGNGFDIAHGLPTRYKDFLGIMNRVLRTFCECLFAAIDRGNSCSEIYGTAYFELSVNNYPLPLT